MTTFDRYLLSRFFHVTAVFFVAALGLFIIVDGFTNLDAFQQRALGPSGEVNSVLLVQRMTVHYAYKSLAIIDLAGPTIAVLSSMVALTVMLRHGEIHPLLAAGVPTYRLALPLMAGSVVISSVLLANQEFILPRIAPHLLGNHGDTVKDAQVVKAQYDPRWRIWVSGAASYPVDQRISQPELLLPAPALVTDPVTVRADDAIYLPAQQGEPAGWLLLNVSPPIDQLPLTEAGREIVVPQENHRDLFVALTVTFDQLCHRNASLRLVSTAEILRRLRQPAGSENVRRLELVHLHARLTAPLLNLVGICLVIPLICRKDRMSPMQQVANVAQCMAALGIVFAANLVVHFLGQGGAVPPEQAVWGPLIVSAGFAGWLSGVVRT